MDKPYCLSRQFNFCRRILICIFTVLVFLSKLYSKFDLSVVHEKKSVWVYIKTSLRERAGQIYKWKLMCDLATCKREHMKDNPECTTVKYGLEYEPTRPVKMCIITADFYDEISNPQIHGIFNFFDYSYITKEIEDDDNIVPLGNVIADLNALFPDNNEEEE